MKRILFALALGGILMAMISCSTTPGNNTTGGNGSNSSTNGNDNNNSGGNVSNSDTSGIDKNDEFEKILGFDVAKTALSSGNNYRMKKVIEKIKAGDDVYVACLGGSITEGECGNGKDFHQGYAYLFPNQLQETFAKGKSNVHSVVAGVSGTPSPLGLIRYKKDVVDKLGRTPDLLVIEFAVNDWQECTDTGAFEQLIREVLESSEDAAVIALYSIASYGSQNWAMSPVASYYKIPEVDMKDAKGLKGFWTPDNIHPSVDGHKIMANSLMYMMKQIDKAKADEKIAIPASYKNTISFSGYTPLLFGDEVGNTDITEWDVGSFKDNDNATQGLKVGGTAFPKNWCHKSGSEPLSMKINCKNMIIAYKNSGCGKAEVFVDGVSKITIDGGANGWNNVSVALIFNESTAKEHTIEIKMAEGNDNKQFTICGLGYSK